MSNHAKREGRLRDKRACFPREYSHVTPIPLAQYMIVLITCPDLFKVSPAKIVCLLHCQFVYKFHFVSFF